MDLSMHWILNLAHSAIDSQLLLSATEVIIHYIHYTEVAVLSIASGGEIHKCDNTYKAVDET